MPTMTRPRFRALERAVELLRTLVRETFTTDDPAPHRDVVFRIAVQEATGREAFVPEPEVRA